MQASSPLPTQRECKISQDYTIHIYIKYVAIQTVHGQNFVANIFQVFNLTGYDW